MPLVHDKTQNASSVCWYDCLSVCLHSYNKQAFHFSLKSLIHSFVMLFFISTVGKSFSFSGMFARSYIYLYTIEHTEREHTPKNNGIV